MSKSFIIEKGDLFRETVNSQIGYEDWEYTGRFMIGPDAEDTLWYAMQNDLGVYWYTEDEIRGMERIGKNILATIQNN